jgi:hypothetical protein
MLAAESHLEDQMSVLWILVFTNIVFALNHLLDNARIQGLEKRMAEVEKRLEVTWTPKT